MTPTQGTDDDRLNLTCGGSHAVKALSLKVEGAGLVAFVATRCAPNISDLEVETLVSTSSGRAERQDGSAVVVADRHREVARLRAVRIEPTDRKNVHDDGSGSGLTQASPFVIRFSFSTTEQTPPPPARLENDGSYVIESFGLQRDLEALLMWAQDEAVQLHDLSAGPHRVVGAAGAAGFDHAVA